MQALVVTDNSIKSTLEQESNNLVVVTWKQSTIGKSADLKPPRVNINRTLATINDKQIS